MKFFRYGLVTMLAVATDRATAHNVGARRSPARRQFHSSCAMTCRSCALVP